jgi:hypothetical protein
MSITDVFIGAPQSRIAGITVLVTLAITSVFILAGTDKIAFGQKVATVVLMLLVALPTILLTLFQITCVVKGAGVSNQSGALSLKQRWWCSWYAWIVAVLVVIYCVMLLIVCLTLFANGKSVLAEMQGLQAANSITREYFENAEEEEVPTVEGFEGEEGEGEGEGEEHAMEGFAARRERFTGPMRKERFASGPGAKDAPKPPQMDDIPPMPKAAPKVVGDVVSAAAKERFVDYPTPAKMGNGMQKEEDIEGFTTGGFAAF